MWSGSIGVAEFRNQIDLERKSLEYLPGADDGDDAVLRRPLFGGRSDSPRQHVSDGRRGCRVHAMAAGFRKSEAS